MAEQTLQLCINRLLSPYFHDLSFSLPSLVWFPGHVRIKGNQSDAAKMTTTNNRLT